MRVVSGVVLGSGLLGGLVYWDRRGGDGVVYGDIGEEEEVRSEVRELESVVRDISRWERTRVAEEIGRVKKEFLERQLGDLKEEIGLMEHELEQRARWEGIRSEEAARAKVLEVRSLARAKEFEREKKLRKKAQEDSEKIIAAIKADRASFVDRAGREQVVDKQELIREHFEAELRARAEALDQLVAEKEAQMIPALATAREEHDKVASKPLVEMEHKVKAAEADMDHAKQQYEKRCAAHRLCSAALELKKSATAASVKQVENAAKAAGATMTTALTEVLSDGHFNLDSVPSEHELLKRFEIVAKEGRKAAMIPEGRSLGALAFLLAGVLDRIKVYGESSFDGDGADKAISRALNHAHHGNLLQSVEEITSIQGLPAELCHDWLQAARARVLIDQTVQAAVTESLAALS